MTAISTTAPLKHPARFFIDGEWAAPSCSPETPIYEPHS
jgi:hypothetical protein